MPDATPLNDELRAFLQEMVEAQQSGQFQPVMGFSLARGRRVVAQKLEGRENVTVCEGIAPAQLRALAAAGLLSVSTPRSHWRLRLRPAAFEAVASA